MGKKIVSILLVEDNLGDIRLTQEALKEVKLDHSLEVAQDGVAAWNFLLSCKSAGSRLKPDFILMDLNLPKKNGRELLKDLKSDSELKSIPVMVLSTSHDERDIQSVYDLHGNCYVGKPVNFEEFISLMQLVKSFWFHFVKLPPKEML